MNDVEAPAPTRLRIVLVDDSVDDAELAMIELRNAGLDVECRCVDREASLIETLDDFSPQLVLSDLNMPGFSGQHAFEIVREHAPGARFVFLTGAVKDNAGLPAADAVLLKHELHALPGLVRRLLGE
jgi:two-component system, OmpR family, response regulator